MFSHQLTWSSFTFIVRGLSGREPEARSRSSAGRGHPQEVRGPATDKHVGSIAKASPYQSADRDEQRPARGCREWTQICESHRLVALIDLINQWAVCLSRERHAIDVRLRDFAADRAQIGLLGCDSVCDFVGGYQVLKERLFSRWKQCVPVKYW